MESQFTDGAAAKTYTLAGNARVTLVSGATGARFTYRISKSKARANDDRPPVHFVALLSGPDNGADYTFLGTIFADGTFRHGRNSRIAKDAPSARAFDWAWDYLLDENLPPRAEVWHVGRCGRCGRALTVPESIASGLGPVCAGM
jgi:hypothetical protein